MLACPFGSSASAQEPYRLAIGEVFASPSGWTVGRNPVGGCLAAATYKDGTTVWFGLKGDSENVVAFTNEAWKSIEPNRSYQIRLQARGQGNWRGTFQGMERRDEKGLIASSLKKEFLIDMAKAGGLLLYFEDKEVARLTMGGSTNALLAVIDCQKRYFANAATAKPEEGRTTAPPSNREERKGESSGTGFFVSTNGHVLTNEHVIADCSTFEVMSNGTRTKANVAARDKTNDLALLTTDLKPTAVPPFNTRARIGENVYVYGFPLSGLLATTGNFTTGNITATAGLRDDTRMIQISAPVQPGNSGGPVKDRFGNIVGVIVSKLNAMKVAKAVDDIPQNVNFAIKASIAQNFLDSNGVSNPTALSTTALDSASVAEAAKAFTVRIVCR